MKNKDTKTKDKRKYFFVGTRFFCVEKMLDMGLDIICFATLKDSFLARELEKRNIFYVTLENKNQLLKLIKETDFDIMISNGCPYILPVSKIKKENQLFINLHPSLLPDLKGMNPVNGSILFNRPQGATCHLMDDGIDTGEIIAQVRITEKANLPLDLLYQLTFMAEAEAFLIAYEKNFCPIQKTNTTASQYIYYSRKEEDRLIDRNDEIDLILRKVKAFQVEGQYAKIVYLDKEYEIKDLIRFDAEYPDIKKKQDFEILFVYKQNVVTAYRKSFLLWRLDTVDGIIPGSLLL